MFEDALVESTGRLKTQSKYWTLGTFAFNGGLLGLLILLPLLHPEALPKTAMAAIMVAPAPPPPPAVMRAAPVTQATQRSATTMLVAPSRIPAHINESDEPPSAPITSVGPWIAAPGGSNVGNLLSAMGNQAPIVVSRPKPPARITVSRGVVAGNLINRTEPIYPAIAKAAHISGTVTLRAIISKTGLVENLTVESGPVMLRQAALDGVKNWRYKPFLLNGEPTEVDTTIIVNFTNES